MRARLNARAGTCLLATILAVWSGGVRAAAPGARTVVTLAFDDGLEEQRQVLDMLSASGLKATFYIISGRVGQSSYMTVDDLRRLAAAGHDVGGHTLQHAELLTMSPDAQRQEVCEDRLRLLSWGLAPTGLAFPFGSNDAAVNQMAATCGYNSARDVRGLADTCGSCPPAETIPPFDAYEIRTPATVTRDDTMETMQSWVTSAEEAGGGWVIVVFHFVQPDCSKRTYCVNTEVLREYMTWLSQRAPMGTEVRTVQDIMGGAARPAVHPVPKEPTAELKNPSLEADENGDGVPDCWQLGPSYGSTVRTERSPEAHSGAWAYRLERMDASGESPAVHVLRDDGTCAPTVTPGRSARVSVWYRSSTPMYLKASVQGTDGTWRDWERGPSLPPAEAWTEAAWELPVALPADARGLSVGLAMEGAGWALVDDFAVADAEAPAARLVLDTPTGGEELVAGQEVEVKWSTFGDVPTVEVAYSTEASADWVPVATALANTGSFMWRVPDMPSQETLLRVTSTADGTVTAMSAPFRILARGTGETPPGETPPMEPPPDDPPSDDVTGDGQVTGESGGCGGCDGTGTGEVCLAVAGGLLALLRSRAKRRVGPRPMKVVQRDDAGNSDSATDGRRE